MVLISLELHGKMLTRIAVRVESNDGSPYVGWDRAGHS
jgi:hypothetical protein